MKIQTNVIKTCMHAFLCESANDVSEKDEENKYLFILPLDLSKHLEEVLLLVQRLL